MAIGAYQHARSPKDLHWIHGASHVDLSDKEQYVAPALAKLTDFYDTDLTAVSDKVAAPDRKHLESAVVPVA
jgi:uncharacterized protein